jgi:hypothetical protein
MDRSIVWKIVIALLAVAAVVGVGFYGYRLGLAQVIATSGKVPAATPGFYPYPFRGFHPFGFVFPLLFFFLLFGLGRRLFWGGWGGPRGWRDGGSPTDLEKWHREAHEQMSRQG